MRAFAAEAGVKPATLLRLAQRLGYNGWRELKSAFIDDLGLGNDTYVYGIIYIIMNICNTKIYIGQTTSKNGFYSRYRGGNFLKYTNNNVAR